MNNQEFDNYVKDFDMNNWMIYLKYHHTYRVVDYAEQIAISENLSKKDIDLAKTAALLHDIARFRQAKEYNTFDDSKSFDHGDEGYNILVENNYISKYTQDKGEQDIVLKAVKLHNKIYLEGNLTDREKLICKIVRDADKLDIFDKQNNQLKDNKKYFNKQALEQFKNKELVTNEYVDTDITKLLRSLAFVFDFNFKKSFEIIKEKKIIERKMDLLKEYLNENEVDEINNIVKQYVKERLQ